MFTLRKWRGAGVISKTVCVYLILAAACIAIDNIYALFGHGVRSQAMSLMFLYPLLGGAALYLLLGALFPGIAGRKGCRLYCNLYNSGIAILTVEKMLQGILEIAGTDSVYLRVFTVLGWLFVICGLTAAAGCIVRKKRV